MEDAKIEAEVPEAEVPEEEADQTEEARLSQVKVVNRASPEARGTPPTHHRAVVIATTVMVQKLGTVWHP